ncbi:MAG: hypothetical protein F6K23_01450 [Okeania sp. SIO2C9]|uniref:hypothetical protein n=1 Tax=Okeania sp. SIO2C9 TaxID=2607791 RepID=UPI0013C18D9C|nr:hypothetical protein [Okeania sp. SIO2C9]NEQ71860.1 hypothetical protein [Okeania sp. SIO2C9]
MTLGYYTHKRKDKFDSASILLANILVLLRKKEEGRRKKEEGRRKKEEGRRKKEEGRKRGY